MTREMQFLICFVNASNTNKHHIRIFQLTKGLNLSSNVRHFVGCYVELGNFTCVGDKNDGFFEFFFCDFVSLHVTLPRQARKKLFAYYESPGPESKIMLWCLLVLDALCWHILLDTRPQVSIKQCSSAKFIIDKYPKCDKNIRCVLTLILLTGTVDGKVIRQF